MRCARWRASNRLPRCATISRDADCHAPAHSGVNRRWHRGGVRHLQGLHGAFCNVCLGQYGVLHGPEDFLTGVIKAFIYGGIIGMISCYKGMTCREGAEGVGRATTEAVVFSSITILITNFFLTLILNNLIQPA
jgi:hypothetical protein